MFENESRNDLETNLSVTLKNTKASRITVFAAALVILAAGIIVLVLELLYPDSEPDYFDAVIILVLGVFFLLLSALWKPFFRLILKKSMQGKEGVNLYHFSEEGYDISTKLNDGTTSTTQGNYYAITQCKEFPEFWLLYLNKASYFIVVKDGMKTRTAEELSQFLRVKFGAKYKVCYKKR